MKTRLTSLALAMALLSGMAVWTVGCSRSDPVTTPNPVSAGTVLDDAVVTTRVRSALLADESIKGFEIKVETRKGVVFSNSGMSLKRVLFGALCFLT